MLFFLGWLLVIAVLLTVEMIWIVQTKYSVYKPIRAHMKKWGQSPSLKRTQNKPVKLIYYAYRSLPPDELKIAKFELSRRAGLNRYGTRMYDLSLAAVSAVIALAGVVLGRSAELPSLASLTVADYFDRTITAAEKWVWSFLFLLAVTLIINRFSIYRKTLLCHHLLMVEQALDDHERQVELPQC